MDFLETKGQNGEEVVVEKDAHVMSQMDKVVEENPLVENEAVVEAEKEEGELVDGGDARNSTGGRRGIMGLGGRSGGEEAEAEGGEVEEEVSADELVGGGEGDRVEEGEEAVEARSTGRKVVVVAGTGIGEPGGAVDDEILEVAAEANEEETVVGELAEGMVGAFHVVEGVIGDKVLVEPPSAVDLPISIRF